MPPNSTMRQIAAKTVGFKIEIMKWSNRMDLLAISNDKGEVIVQRLNWQKILTNPPSIDGIKVRGIDWQPDEKIIAVGYNNGAVTLLDIESQQEIHTTNFGCDITCLGWTNNTKEVHDDDEIDDNPLNNHETYLPQLPSFNSLSLTSRRLDNVITKSYSKKVLNLLLIGLANGQVHLSVFGVLPCGSIDVGKFIGMPADEFQIVDAKMSADFRRIFIFLNIGNLLRLVIFEIDVYSEYTLPLLKLATKHGYILNTMTYIEEIIQCITEAWETALLEMDNKLTKYANSQPDGSVSADFLELLVFGNPSEALTEFLTQDLTEKELKKLGISVEISYSTIQKLVIKPLHSGILNICFHLNCIKGMSQNSYFYKPILGTMSNDAMKNAGAFLIKTLELLQIIEQSAKDYKIFWSWLNGVLIRIMDETVMDDVAAVSQQDIMHLAEFLNSFDQKIETSLDESQLSATRRKFNLERVGQYLENKNLVSPIKCDFIPKWDQLLAENECLRNCESIYPHNKELSLVQQHNVLKSSITELFMKPQKLVSEKFKFCHFIDCATEWQLTNNCNQPSSTYTTHINIECDNVTMIAGVLPGKEMFFLELDCKKNRTAGIRLEFQRKTNVQEQSSQFGELTFRHIQFFNDEILSILLDNSLDDGQRISNCFIQFPVTLLRTKLTVLNDDVGHGSTTATKENCYSLMDSVSVTNFYDLLDVSMIKSIDGFDGYILSVSGSRKVASLLSESQKRIRLYEMEADDDDDELDMSLNNSLDISRESKQSN